MFKKRSTVLTLSVIVATTSVIAGCGKETETTASAAPSAASTAAASSATPTAKASNIKGEVTFMTYRDDLLNSWYPAVLKEFEAKYPGVKVITSTSKNFRDDVKVKMVANEMPDVVTLPLYEYADSLKKEYLLSLDDQFPNLVSDWEGLGSSKADDQKIYGLPYGLATYGVIYNKKIFSDLKLTPPKTLDELLATAKKIKSAGFIGLVADMKPIWTFETYAKPIPRFFNDSFKAYQHSMTETDAPFTADSPYGKTFQLVQKIAQAGVFEADPVSYDWEPMKADYAAGKIGMYYGYSQQLAQFYTPDSPVQPKDMGFIPMPYDNTGGPYKVAYEPDWSLSISKKAKNPEAAKALYTFLMDEKYKAYAEQTGVLSARKSVTITNAALDEFNSYKPVKVFNEGDDSQWKTISDKAQINYNQELISVALGKDINAKLDELNGKWKKARAAVK
ncbi:hypothetical protein A8709_28570 [Paenibacillus pectinilyticus]|uniref:ABC transporter substrate-binding protein n=1 Tax=Paenibacillus pectinilyticus TaxID=512399 RepID=A0A1C0ZUP9_9BACL|nr:extracellular solute-binding protein [Paenibacillus pectinilyticus]OCT11824.1 hypothetical protein A8709_28570 [Paenibacillus pectinilyticus]